jgi:hypothetical protein
MPRRFPLSFGLIFLFAPACQASVLGTIVPAYFYPGTGGPGGSGDGWAAMAAAASQISLTAIFNPDSGPLPGPPDANYTNAMTNLENAGGHVVAYIYTDYGATPLATVESEVSTYLSQYGSLIDGFFLDAMSNLPAQVAYYQSIDSYVKGLSPTYNVIGNPGTSTDQSYLTGAAANTFVTFENNQSAFPGYTPPSWVYTYPSSDFANIVYNAPTTADMLLDIAQAGRQNTGYIYVTDQNLPNPYGELPSYWNQEVSALAAASAPEPATGPITAAAGLLALCIVSGRRFSSRPSRTRP